MLDISASATSIGPLPLSVGGSASFSPDAGLSGSISLGGLPTLDPLSLLPTKADLVSALNQACSLPSILSMAGLADEAAAVRSALSAIGISIDTSGFPFQLTSPIYQTLRIPEFEFERRITALIEDAHAMALAKMTSAIQSFLPSLPIPLNVSILGIDVNLLDFATNPLSILQGFRDQAMGLLQQAQQVQSDVVGLLSGDVSILSQYLPSPYSAWANAAGVLSPDLIIENVISYGVATAKGMLLDALNTGIQGLLSEFSSLAGNLSFLLQNPFDFDSIVSGAVDFAMDQINSLKDQALGAISSQIQGIVSQIRGLQQQALNAIESISIFGFTPLDIIGGKPLDRIRSLEREFHRNVEALYHFQHNWRRYLTSDWIINQASGFLDAIGLPSLTDLASFGLSDFLSLAGIPTSIDLGIDIGPLSAGLSLDTSNISTPSPF